ncbi:hemerythrin family protein [Paramagnetospirillum caucaseum]|uniref:hemerythrin family protein n=1 Tax=Paramagnetospirillum caucaseum TaxID=1244869 RepID=UPI00034984BB|nr:hemerythrin family protein [Paramagnetospirillum caucaseum]
MAIAASSSLDVNALVAIENAATRKLIVSVMRECGFVVQEETKDISHTMLHLEHGNASNINIILCDKLGGSGHLKILKHVRWGKGQPPQSLPIIALDNQWTADELIEARDAGISASLTLPITRHTLQMAVTATMTKQKAFIASPMFHGPDRRSAVMKSYKGPFRRADDAQTRRQEGSPVIAQSVAQRQIKSSDHHQDVASSSSSVDTKTEMGWSAAIATGREDIDEQHQKIIDFLKILGATSSAEYERKAVDDVLNGLSNYVKMHFMHEETLMDSFDYDERDKHKRIHSGFVEKLDRINRDDFHNGGGSEKLFYIIYNWLVTHIVSIDRVMIAKMNGEYDANGGGDPVLKQTGLVIENAYELAAKIMNVNLQTSAVADKKRKTALLRDISKSTERLINLMELADSRVQVSGCSNFQLKRLGEIRHALTKSADSLAVTAAKKIIRLCGDILSGKQGIPLGIGDILRRQMGRVASLTAVIGGLDAMSSTAKSAAIEANEVAGKILEMELGSAASLQDFDIVEK